MLYIQRQPGEQTAGGVGFGFEARGAGADGGEFGGDEITVERDQTKRRQDLEKNVHVGILPASRRKCVSLRLSMRQNNGMPELQYEPTTRARPVTVERNGGVTRITLHWG